ncbi:MAG: glucosaminidase domain-containing protein [Atopobium sp.]|nr:glucosaminidase domain-containing protein [Atopobium sp.]
MLTLGSTDVTSINGAEIAVAVTASDGAIISVKTSDSNNITYWLDPGTLYIYPKQSGTVTVTASSTAYQSVSQDIKVTYVVQTATPAPTAAPAADSSSSGSSATVQTPTLTRDSDLSFWFRSGSGMDGTKDYFFDYAASYGVDPWLCIAIADHETGYGSSDLCINSYNFGGLMDRNGNPKVYDDKSNGVEALVWLISWYYRQGRTTIESIGEWYCPGQGWVDRVTTIYNSFH